MVAYSFQQRFAPPIKARTKTHTIRARRNPPGRHAVPGKALQLYTGMRTQHCAKIIDDPVCTRVAPICIWFDAAGRIENIEIERDQVSDLDGFAVQDGFADAADMARFWEVYHSLQREFRGVLIGWGGPYSDRLRAG